MQQKTDYFAGGVGSVLTDLAYTKTRHHDKYKDIQPFWNEEMHRRLIAAIFDFGLKEASPRVIYPALKEYSISLRPENIKSHLQKYRSNSKANQLEYLHFFERNLRREKKAASKAHMLQIVKQDPNSDSTSPPQNLLKSPYMAPSTDNHSVPNFDQITHSSTPEPVTSPYISSIPGCIEEDVISPFNLSSPAFRPDSNLSNFSRKSSTDNPRELTIPHINDSCGLHTDSTCDVDAIPDFQFHEDPSMEYQVALHDDIISKHSIRQQRMGLDGIDNDNRFVPTPDYASFYDSYRCIESEDPDRHPEETTDSLCFLQDNDN